MNKVKQNVITGDNNSVSYILNQYITKTENQEKLHKQVKNYISWVKARYGTLELRGIKREGQQVVQLDLEKVYIPLKAFDYQGEVSIEMDQVLGLNKKIVITGGPGSGKTTVLLHLAYQISLSILKDNPNLAKKKLGFEDNALDELKSKIQNINNLIRSQDWYTKFDVVDGLLPPKDDDKRKRTIPDINLDKILIMSSNLPQIGIDSGFQIEIENAISKLEKIWPAVREYTELKLNPPKISDHIKQIQNKKEISKELTEEEKILWSENQKILATYEKKKLSFEENLLAKEDIAHDVEKSVSRLEKVVSSLKDALPLPIFVPLSAFAAYLRRLPSSVNLHETTLSAFISKYLIEKQSNFHLEEDFFTELLKDGRAVILLLDGLDEVPNEAERVRIREAIEELVTNRPSMWVIVTCRTAAYKDRTALGRDFIELRVQPLRSDLIEAMIKQAYAHIYQNEIWTMEEKSKELIVGIEHLESDRRKRFGNHIEPLVTSPLLIRMLLVVHFSERRLPEQRAELYMKATDAMLLPEYAPDQVVADDLGRQVGGSKEIHRELVQYIAYSMHERGENQGREISERELSRIVDNHSAYSSLLNDFIALTRLRGTLLEERLGSYRFIHLAFQEFLTARYLAEVVRGEAGINGIVKFLKGGRILDSWWIEPALLVAGYLNVTSPQTAQLFLRRLSEESDIDGEAKLPSEIQMALAQLAASALLEWPSVSQELRRIVVGRLEKLFTNKHWISEISPNRRVEVGDLIARLGDVRKGVGLDDNGLPDLLWCDIPAGYFYIGSQSVSGGSSYHDVIPKQKIKTKRYRISKYPITNIQFESFVHDGGYTDKWKHCWSGEGWFWKGSKTSQKYFDDIFSLPNHPVVGVSWYEAIAFCSWLTERLRKLKILHLDELIILPSESQWEKAGRGSDSREFPWGDEELIGIANHSETGIGNTSAVGCFPNSVSPFGCEDFSGNVWEWCATKWQKSYGVYKENNNIGGSEMRIVKGGSWKVSKIVSSCFFRGGGYPHSSDADLGFRIVAIKSKYVT